LGHEPVVILVRMREDHAEERTVIGRTETGYVREIDYLTGLRVQRAPEIEHEALALNLQLDAVAADLACPAMNPRAY
jgi:hypothetical protein